MRELVHFIAGVSQFFGDLRGFAPSSCADVDRVA
jgi:hypothetical protein